ncbi:hypothetical protein MCEMSEM23_02710 [Rhabdaerophilaceae bacterium]
MFRITRMVSMLITALALSLALVFTSPALARGPGSYAVKGKEGGSSSTYSGSATLTKIGTDTWRIAWRIGGQTWNGFGIGDGKFIALNFSGNGQSGVMLLVAKDGGSGYEAVWAYNGEREAGGYEDWSKN